MTMSHFAQSLRDRSTDPLCRGSAPVKNLAHSASFHAAERIAPANPGIKQVVLSGQGWYHLNMDHGIGTPFVNVQIDFHAPVTPRSDVETEVRVLCKGETSVTFELRGSQLEEQVFSGTVTCVFIIRGQRTAIQPPDWIAAPLQRFLPQGDRA